MSRKLITARWLAGSDSIASATIPRVSFPINRSSGSAAQLTGAEPQCPGQCG